MKRIELTEKGWGKWKISLFNNVLASCQSNRHCNQRRTMADDEDIENMDEFDVDEFAVDDSIFIFCSLILLTFQHSTIRS